MCARQVQKNCGRRTVDHNSGRLSMPESSSWRIVQTGQRLCCPKTGEPICHSAMFVFCRYGHAIHTPLKSEAFACPASQMSGSMGLNISARIERQAASPYARMFIWLLTSAWRPAARSRMSRLQVWTSRVHGPVGKDEGAPLQRVNTFGSHSSVQILLFVKDDSTIGYGCVQTVFRAAVLTGKTSTRRQRVARPSTGVLPPNMCQSVRVVELMQMLWHQ